ncbi:hypothetical protein [Streptomyces sp. NPDC057438]|uniref:hypothetical protein n=1 Tax=Streptomyces sp. NPDC057438 TaxID=3346133 RepID=UPI0036746156
MTAAAAFPGAGAVLRATRGAAARRTVRVALLVGGLFALGVLCGARASAADDGAPVSSSRSAAVINAALPAAVTDADPERVVRPPIETITADIAERDTEDAAESTADPALPPVAVPVLRPPVADPVLRPSSRHALRPVAERFAPQAVEHVVPSVVDDLVQPVAEDLVRPVVEDVVQPVIHPVLRPVAESVVVPVGDLVESVTEGLAGVASPLPPSPLPPSGGTPSLPGVPGLPEPSGWTTLPVESPLVEVAPREPGREQPGSGDSAVDGDGRGDGGSDGERTSGPASVTYGPPAAGVWVGEAPRRGAGAGDADVVRVPDRPNPGGLATGALGRHSVGDNGGPRHAEPQTVVTPDRAPLTASPGAPAADAPHGTRDRHRDIPTFPG